MITAQTKAMLLQVGEEKVRIPLQVNLSWDGENDPLAVDMTILGTGNGQPVIWTFAHDLLTDGYRSATFEGLGDVRIRVVSGTTGTPNHILVCLKNAEGHADIAIPYQVVTGFLEATLAEERDEAHLGGLIDADLARLLEPDEEEEEL